ncbi:MAG TPA: hypothetical protein VFM55_09235 [Micromonosporaceae bacterium]|nr:hypothetical protein [Micromonosporaceae bacterium]
MTNGRYPTALTAPSQQDPQAIRAAIAWVHGQLEPGRQALVWTPNRSALMEHPDLVVFARRHTSMTRKTSSTMRWSGGPVLAGWPDTDALDELAEDRRVSALCVIPHGTLDEVAAWAARTGATRLGTAAVLPALATLDPVVERGLEALTGMVNHANNLAGVLDKRDAVNVLTTLHQGGYPLDPEAVHSWVLAHGWPARGAQRLREMCDKLVAGRTLRAGAPSILGRDVLQQWQQSVTSR